MRMPMYQPGLPSVDTEWSPPAMDAVPILLSLFHTIGKRSAEAEPYYGYGYLRPVGHSTYGVSQFHPSGHSFQHVTRLHKREAEAQPEADPYYGYGYGLGYGHGLG